MKRNKNKLDVHNYLGDDFDIKDPTTKTVAELKELIKTRYSKKFLEEVVVEDKEDYFKLTVQTLQKLFSGQEREFRISLAFSLLKMLEEDDIYKNIELTTASKFFLAALVHVCFNNIKDYDTEFCETFRTLDANKGIVSAFGRFIAICEIEYYCSFVANDIRTEYVSVIKNDSEVFCTVKIEQEEVIFFAKFLWELYGKLDFRKQKMLGVFLSSGKYESYRLSPYWSNRPREDRM